MSHSDRSVDVSTSSPVPTDVIESAAARWFLVEANRWVLAGLFSAGVFLAFFVLGWAGVIGVTPEDPPTLLLSVLIAGNLTLVPITITINQLVLSREFGKPHELRTRDEGVRQLREDLEELADVAHIPPSPKEYRRVLVETVDERADDVQAAADATDDEELRQHVDTFRERVDASTGQLNRALDTAEFGSFELLSAMLRVNSGWLMEGVHDLQHGRLATLPDEPLDRMEQTLRLFNVSRQYTKTLHMQKEISTLSRLLLYVGFAALLTSSLVMLLYASPIQTSLPPTALLAVVSLTNTVAFTPIAFLLSYMLRLSTVVSYTPLRNAFITDG